MKLEKFEYLENKGLIIDNKKYGTGITKIEIDGFDIKIHIHKDFVNKYNFDDSIEGLEDYNNPYDLIKYENIKIIEE